MIRRPPTNIELKLDDLGEYEAYRRQQESSKDQQKNNKSVQEPTNWNAGPKAKQEIYDRIGFVPTSGSNVRSRSPEY